jgi:hypothetical protein
VHPADAKIKAVARGPSPNQKIPVSLTKTFSQNQKSIKSDIDQFVRKMNDESPQRGHTLTPTAQSTDDIDPPSQKKRNHKDALVPIPPSPLKFQKTTSSESNTKNKKGITPTAKIAAEDAFKPFNAIAPVNLMGVAPPRLYIKTVANGLFHLIYVQELNGTEAFSHPLIEELFPNPAERIGKKTDFVRRTGIIAAAPRRTSKALNIPLTRKASGLRVFKAMVYVSILDSNGATCKRNVLSAVTDVSTENKTKNLFYRIPRRYPFTPSDYSHHHPHTLLYLAPQRE